MGRARRIEGARRLAWVAAVLPWIGGCLLSTPPFTVPPASDVPALEAAIDEAPGDPEVRAGLVGAYVREGRLADARALLSEGGGGSDTELIRAFVADDIGETAEAVTGYQRVLGASSSTELRALATVHLEGYRPWRVRDEVGAAIREAMPLRTGQDERSTLVLPLRDRRGVASETDQRIAVQDLLATDLARVEHRVIDPMNARAAISLLEIPDEELDQLATAVDLARRFGVRRVVFGEMGSAPRSTLDVKVVTLTESGVSLSAIQESGGLVAVLERVTMRVHAILAGDLDEADARRLAERQLVSAEAMALYGFGLRALDASDQESALASFTAASDLDPTFEMAAERAAVARAISEVRTISPVEKIELVARAAERERSVRALYGWEPSGATLGFDDPDLSDRAPLAELLGLDVLGARALLDLTFLVGGGS